MPDDKKLEEQLKMYQEAAKGNKNVDIAALMLNALEKQEANTVSPKTKKWAYIISLGAPPFGLLFALKYYFSEESDARSVATTCVLLTVVALLGVYVFFKLIFAGSPISPQQIEQIKPSDIQQLTQ